MPQTTQHPTEEPKLWNPISAVNWSILLSPVFGSYILAQNAKAAGESGRARVHTIWFWIAIAYQVVATACSLTQDFSIRGTGLLILVAWYFSAAKRDITTFKSRQHVAQRTWNRPLTIGFGSAACIYMLSVFGPGSGASTELATNATTEFHRSYNIHDFEKIYTQSHEKLKASAPPEKFVSLLSGIRKKAGKHIGSTQAGWHITSFNSTKSITITYDSQFESLHAKETFTYVIGKNEASLIRYNIASADFAVK